MTKFTKRIVKDINAISSPLETSVAMGIVIVIGCFFYVRG